MLLAASSTCCIPLLLQKQYQVVLEPNLSPYLYKFSTAEQLIPGDRDTHVTFKFTVEVIYACSVLLCIMFVYQGPLLA